MEKQSFSGIQDVIDHLVFSQDETTAIGGVKPVILSQDMANKVDHMLSILETQECLGAFLFLNKSILHTRVDSSDTRMALYYSMARPLNTLKMESIPISSNNSWKRLTMVKVDTYILGLVSTLRTPHATIEALVDSFVSEYVDKMLDLPVEEQPLQLRQFHLSNDVVAFTYLHRRTRYTIAPQLRSSSDTEKHSKIFSYFHRKAQDTLAHSHLPSLVLTWREYTFFIKSDPVEEVSVLYTGSTAAGRDMKAQAAEIVSIIRAKLHDQIV